MTDSTTDSNSNWYQNLTNDALRTRVLGRDAVVVYSSDLESVLWANVSGAKLFGGNTIDEFINQSVEPGHPFIRQLASAAKQLDDEQIIRGFRVVDSGKSKLLLCEIDTINIDGNISGILISCTNETTEEMREHEFLQVVLESLPDFNSARAICDEYGLLMAASDEFVELDILPEELEKACARTNAGNTSLEVVTGTGSQLDLLRFQLNDDPVRVLVLANELDATAGNNVEADSVPNKSEDENETEQKGFVGGVVAGVAAASTVLFGQRKGEMQENDDHTDFAEQEDLGVDEVLSHADSEETITGQEDDSGEFQASQDEALPGEVETLHAVNGPDETENTEFEFSADGEPIRFAWTTDTNLVFTSISDELAKAVGPNAADLIGRKWGDVATVFGFDANGEIRSLLQKQDTWSGKSVLWPIQGTDLHVPVDLAALPSFSRGRSFDGFRGFGIVRMLDTIVDPEETGMALVGGGFFRSVDTQSDEEQSDMDEIFHNDETSGSDNSEEINPEDNRDATNIVDLKAHRHTADEYLEEDDNRELSNGEHKAFDEIGRKLRDPSMFAVTRLQASETDKNSGDRLDDKQDVTHSAPVRELIVDTSLLEKLPVPVIVYRGSETLFANQELLSLSGYSDFQELQNAGGIEALFGDGNNDEIIDENYTILNDRDGGQLRVKALLKSVPWDSERALLMSFRQPQHEELPANEKIVLDMMQVSELQNILNTATDGIVIVSNDGEIQSLNPSAEALFGMSDDEFSGKSLDNLFASESHKTIHDYLKMFDDDALQTTLNDGREILGVESNGGLIPLYVTIGKIGNSDKFCLVLRDMTPWQKTQEELVFARKQAEDASEQKTAFLARISHEIRTPLNAIIGFSDVMIEERFGPIEVERYREYLRDINRSGIHVLDLVNDLLDISKIEAGKMELSFEAVDLNKIVGETVALLQPQANGNRVLIRTSLSRAVPNVVADARSIRQIVLNLVSNAIKFTDASGQVIISTVYEGNGEVALRVRDTGRGMNKEEIVVALKPFRQVNALNEPRGKGTGLGLPLTKALVEANKAYLDIESEPGEGTIVHIQFPTQRVLAD